MQKTATRMLGMTGARIMEVSKNAKKKKDNIFFFLMMWKDEPAINMMRYNIILDR